MEPQLVIDDPRGRHNLNEWVERIDSSKMYRDLSTIIITPSRGSIPAKVVRSWFSLITPMNQKVLRMFALGLEVGEAYESMITKILSDKDLSNYRYVLTLEEDNGPPPDGLLKLYESVDRFDIIAGLYWLKGEAGIPMAFGLPDLGADNSFPINPAPNEITECNAVGMGFTLFKLDLFRDERLEKPWFKTTTEFNNKNNTGFRQTQDMYFMKRARELGYKIGIDARVKVGHYSVSEDLWW